MGEAQSQMLSGGEGPWALVVNGHSASVLQDEGMLVVNGGSGHTTA